MQYRITSRLIWRGHQLSSRQRECARRDAAERAAYAVMYDTLAGSGLCDTRHAWDVKRIVEAWPTCGDMSIRVGDYWLTLEHGRELPVN